MASHLERLRDLLGGVFDLRAASAVLEWDQQVNMPSGGAANRAAQLSTIGRLAHEKFISNEVSQALDGARGEAASLDPDSDEARLVRKVEKDLTKALKVPAEFVGEFARVSALAQEAWTRARPANAYWRRWLSVFSLTCRSEDCRRYTTALRLKCIGVILWLCAGGVIGVNSSCVEDRDHGFGHEAHHRIDRRRVEGDGRPAGWDQQASQAQLFHPHPPLTPRGLSV